MNYDNEIGDICLSSYNDLGKSGKPDKNQFSVLAAIVCSDKSSSKRRVVSLTSGTKCFPTNEILKTQRIVDSHAESLLKRAFKRHLISLLNSGSDLEDISSVDLFISQYPCGTIQRWRGETATNPAKRVKRELGFIRKPGRGETCLRATCLHKISKWVFMGLQGNKLIQFTKRPIRINNIVIGNCGPIGEYDQQLVDQWFQLSDSCVAYKPFDLKCLPKIKFCEKFRNDLFIKCDNKESTATSIVMWSTSDGHISEVLTEGHKLGVTKKNMSKNLPLVCDSIINRDIELLTNDRDIKLSEIYEKQWNELKKCQLFEGWRQSNQ